MFRSLSARTWTLAGVLTLAVAAALACGTSTTEKLQQAAQTPTAARPATVAATPTQPAPETPRPTATPLSRPEPLRILAQGFVQDGSTLGLAFIVENPNPRFAFEHTQYQAAAYDANGTVLGTASGYLTLILPGQRLGFADTTWLEEGARAARVEVQLLAGDPVLSDPIPDFTVEHATFINGEFSDTATGLVHSPYAVDLRDVRVSAVLYDAEDQIVGAGYTYVNFVPANQSMGVAVSVVAPRNVARVELYPAVSGLTLLLDVPLLPQGAQPIRLLRQGFGQDETQIGFGMLVENPNAGFAVEDSLYHVAAFAADGSVLATDEGYLEVLVPQQTVGVGGTFYLPRAVEVARVEAHVLSGEFVETSSLPAFSAEQATYRAHAYFPQVTGVILNPYERDITNLRVSALLYDAAGEIVGGGFTYLDFVPARGQAAVELYVVGRRPAAVELYALPSSLSEFR